MSAPSSSAASSAAPASTRPAKSPLPENDEYDFVDKPPTDFFCAVSLELLLDPQQTDCCGHHFTREVAERLKGKPCPMCKKEKMTTHADLYHKRRVTEVQVRCLHKENGKCDWTGEVGSLSQHALRCQKRPWKCAHCGFSGLQEAESQHTSTCELLPVPCPNECEVGTVPRSLVEQHKLDCELEEVGCKYAAFGCPHRFPRRDLERHMKEGETEHLLTMCVTNISLTRQLTEKVEEKDREIKQLQSKVQEMEQELRSVHGSQTATSSRILEVVSEVSQKVAKSETSVVSSMKECLTDIQHQMDTLSCKVPPIEFTVTNFGALMTRQLEWCSPPFYTHHHGYKMRIGVFPHGLLKGFGTHVSLRVYKMLDSNTDQLPWNIRLILRVHIQNQSTKVWEREYTSDSVRSRPDDNCVLSSADYTYLRHAELKHYLKNDQLRIRVTDLAISADSTPS